MNKILLLLLIGLTLQTSVNSQVLSSLNKLVGKTGTSKNIEGEITNLSAETISSLTLTATDGSKSWSENFAGLNILPNAKASFEMTQAVELKNGERNISIAISKINGKDNKDNTTTTVTARGFDLQRPVVVEEATGTWCGFCVRGHVFMNKFGDLYPEYFIGIAVHNSDPMVVTAYDSGLNKYPKFPGYPSAIVSRDTFLDPADMEIPFLDAASKPTEVDLSAKATYDKNTNALTITATSTPGKNLIAAKFFIALVEQGVTGTTAAYNQANYYTNNQLGPMGGYESKPNPVPASQMVYNHVARALYGAVNGITGSIKSPWLKGKEITYVNDSYTIPAEFNIANLKAVVGVMDNNNHFLNVVEIPIEAAAASSEVINNNLFSISPNPFANYTTANIELSAPQSVSMKIINSLGQVVSSKDFGVLSGKQSLPIYGAELQNGIYFVHMQIGNQLATKEVVLVK